MWPARKKDGGHDDRAPACRASQAVHNRHRGYRVRGAYAATHSSRGGPYPVKVRTAAAERNLMR